MIRFDTHCMATDITAAVWSPTNTRFSVTEAKRVLNCLTEELLLIADLDPITTAVENPDDPSARRGYFNFWQLVRIYFYTSIGMSIARDRPCIVLLETLEDELEILINQLANGKMHLYLTASLAATFLQECESELLSNLCGTVPVESFYLWARFCYWTSLCRVASEIDTLLWQDLKDIAGNSCRSPEGCAVN